jgi:hypothetical protein
VKILDEVQEIANITLKLIFCSVKQYSMRNAADVAELADAQASGACGL